MLFHIIGDRSCHIADIIPNIAMTITIIVYRPFTVAWRHKLRHTHCTGIAAFEVKDIFFFFFCHLQKFAQLVLEELGTAWIIKGQCTQGIGNAEAARIFAVIGFDTENRHNQFGRYAVFACHIIDYGTVCRIELSTTIKFDRTRVTGAEFIPRTRSAWAVHNGNNVAFIHHAIKEIAQFLRTETAVFHFILDKLLNIDILIETAAGNRFSRSIKYRAFCRRNRLNRFCRINSRLLRGTTWSQSQSSQTHPKDFDFIHK